MKQRIIMLFMSIILVGIQLNAQKVWSLEDCIEHAIDNNIQIKQRVLTLEESELNVNSSLWALAPNLNLFGSHGYNWGRSVDPTTNEFIDAERVQSNNFNAQSSIDIFNGFQKLNTIKQNRINLEASGQDFQKYLNDISLNIATFYLQTLFYVDNLKNAEEQFKVTIEQVERTKKMVNVGKLAKGDLLALESRAASEQLNVIEAENNLTISYLTLAQLLDIRDIENFKILRPEIELSDQTSILSDANTVYDYAVENQPEIKGAKLRVQSSEKGLAIAKGSLLPRLSGAYSVGTRYSDAALGFGGNNLDAIPFADQLENNYNQSLNFNLNIPIFNGMQNRTYIARQKIAVENSKYSLELEKQNLYKTIQQSYTDAIASLNRYNAAKKKLEATATSFEYATTRYEVKAMTYLEYIEAKKEFDNANRSLISSKYDYIFKKTILDFYLGKPINLTQTI